jgi:hypothetical protein
MRAETEQLTHGNVRFSEMFPAASKDHIASTIYLETGVTRSDLLDIDHRLLDDLGPLRLGRVVFLLHGVSCFP